MLQFCAQVDRYEALRSRHGSALCVVLSVRMRACVRVRPRAPGISDVRLFRTLGDQRVICLDGTKIQPEYISVYSGVPILSLLSAILIIPRSEIFSREKSVRLEVTRFSVVSLTARLHASR